ncbi:transposase [Paenibacillus sp. LHD-38]|uniref:transposase n=1 Tax=Paenibacillus sp. LHD-38 TaxID=3072143 RepID=UPI00280F3E0F|nr:transposase [Paenibacillus sp. LHD-38]MDQ8737151.1 transposase [Paenibacillus sp. LHD-38]
MTILVEDETVPSQTFTKVIIYAYTHRVYSSHQIAKAVRENVMFMWIASRQLPDFRTINHFRPERIKRGAQDRLHRSASISCQGEVVAAALLSRSANLWRHLVTTMQVITALPVP